MSATRVVVLCEDQQHQAFARRCLRQLGFDPHEVRVLSGPSGRQAGDQYVREKYPDETRAQRARAEKAALLVLIDADNHAVESRKRQLDAALVDEGQASRAIAERIALLVPRRNIETWIHCLLEEAAVDETKTYSKLERPRDCGPAAEAFHDACRIFGIPPAYWCPSMRDGCDEFKRVPRASAL